MASAVDIHLGGNGSWMVEARRTEWLLRKVIMPGVCRNSTAICAAARRHSAARRWHRQGQAPPKARACVLCACMR